jgi:hypothetical protein
MKESNQLDVTKVWVKRPENYEQVSGRVNERHVERMAEY